MGATTWEQVSFRVRKDDGLENTATWHQDKNVDHTMAVDTKFRVRFSIASGGMDGSMAAQLEYNLAGAGFLNVTGSSSVVQAVSSDFTLLNGDPTTEQLNESTTFVTGECDANDGLCDSVNIANGSDSEFEFCITIISGDVTNAQEIELQVTRAGTDLNTYTTTCTITVDEAAAETIVADKVTLTLTPQQTVVNAGTIIDAQLVQLTIVTQQTVVKTSITVVADKVALTITPQQAHINETIVGEKVSLTIVPQDTVVNEDRVITADVVPLTISPKETTVSISVTEIADVVVLTLVPQQAHINVTEKADKRTLTITPQETNVTVGERIPADVVVLTIATQEVNVIEDLITLADVVPLTITPQVGHINETIVAEDVSLTITPQQAHINETIVGDTVVLTVVPQQAHINETIVGEKVALTITPQETLVVIGGDKIIVADVVVLTITPQNTVVIAAEETASIHGPLHKRAFVHAHTQSHEALFPVIDAD